MDDVVQWVPESDLEDRYWESQWLISEYHEALVYWRERAGVSGTSLNEFP